MIEAKERNSPEKSSPGLKQHALEIILFLEKYESVWDMHLVDLFILDNLFPFDWHKQVQVSYKELLSLATHSTHPDTWPDSLSNFITQARDIQLNRTPTVNFTPRLEINKHQFMGMSPKKQIEVVTLASYIDTLALENNITTIIDLGYLSVNLVPAVGIWITF